MNWCKEIKARSLRSVREEDDNRELDKVNESLEKVREDAKNLVNMPLEKLGSSEATPIITDLVDQVDSAFVGKLDPATNKRQGGVTLIQDTMPQIATIDVKVFTSL